MHARLSLGQLTLEMHELDYPEYSVVHRWLSEVPGETFAQEHFKGAVSVRPHLYNFLCSPMKNSQKLQGQADEA